MPVFTSQMLFANTNCSSGNGAECCQKMSSVVHAAVAAPQEGSCGSDCRSTRKHIQVETVVPKITTSPLGREGHCRDYFNPAALEIPSLLLQVPISRILWGVCVIHSTTIN